jgi:hypothetical protein
VFTGRLTLCGFFDCALPKEVDSELRQVSVIAPLELIWWEVTQRRVTALPIIETHNVGKDVGLGLLAGLLILGMNVLTFEGAKETLHGSVVITIAGAAHTDLHLLVDE